MRPARRLSLDDPRTPSVPLARRLAAGRHADVRARLSLLTPYLAALRTPPARALDGGGPDGRLAVATYNVHRWTGVRGGRAFEPERAFAVVEELDADVLALQEALRPFDGADPLAALADRLGFHLAFVTTRLHRRGELGNAILSRWPLAGALAIDLSFGRMEQRAALAVEFRTAHGPLTVAATHLALVDATRARQIRALLEHPHLAEGPVVLLGDMNAWRTDPSSRRLAAAFAAHDNAAWPPTYPSMRPVLALDRAYARGARIAEVRAHDSAAARRGSDHLPIVARIVLDGAA